MLSRSFLNELHCPYCDSSLELELQGPPGNEEIHYGVVRCACYRYSILEGILVLRQPPGMVGQNRDPAVAFLEAGDLNSALACALNSVYPVPPPPPRGQRASEVLERYRVPFARSLARRQGGRAFRKLLTQPSLTFQQAVELLRPKGYAHYLFYRHANPSFLAGIGLLLLLRNLDGAMQAAPQLPAEKPRALDFSCGTGHASHLMRLLFPGLSLTLADHDFVNLYLARRFLVTDATFVCIDAECPMPFAKGSFEAVFCLDAFHYVRSKTALLRELNRIIRPDGLWLFPHLHNALVNNFTPGFPLRPEDYLRCFEFIQPRLFAESEILRQLIREQSIDLGGVPRESELLGADALSLVGSRRSDLWRKHSDLASLLVAHTSNLAVNPIYRIQENRNAIRLEMLWPNPMLEAECAAVKNYLPAQCEIAAPLWHRWRDARLSPEDRPVIEGLVKSFILVQLPPGYGGRKTT